MQAQGSEAKKRKLPTGIRERHSRGCQSRDFTKCDCPYTYEASVYDARESRRLGRVVKIRRTFTGRGALAAAKGWRRDAMSATARGELKFEPKQRLDDAVAEWLGKCERGEVRSRRRIPYSASTLRDYRSDLDRFVLPELGHLAVGDITRVNVQTIVERMNGQGFAGQTVRNAVVALQALYRWKKPPIDPTTDLDLPEPGARRERAASPEEAERLVDASRGRRTRCLRGRALLRPPPRRAARPPRRGRARRPDQRLAVVGSGDGREAAEVEGRRPGRAGRRAAPRHPRAALRGAAADRLRVRLRRGAVRAEHDPSAGRAVLGRRRGGRVPAGPRRRARTNRAA